MNERFEDLPSDELSLLLRRFYGEVRRTDGEYYSRSSLCNIRAGIQRHISSPPYNRIINIIRNEAFQRANNVLDGFLKNQKRQKKDTTASYPPISKGDMEKIAASGVLSTESPLSLQRMVFFQHPVFFLQERERREQRIDEGCLQAEHR